MSQNTRYRFNRLSIINVIYAVVTLNTVVCLSHLNAQDIGELSPRVIVGDTLWVVGEETGPESHLLFGLPYIEIDSKDNIWILDSGNCRLLVFNIQGTQTNEYGRNGSGPGEFLRPAAIAPADTGVWTWDSGSNQIALWDANTGLLRTVRPDIPGRVPLMATLSPDGTLWTLHAQRELCTTTEHVMGLYRTILGESYKLIQSFGILQHSDGRSGVLAYLPHLTRAFKDVVLLADDYEYELLSFHENSVDIVAFESYDVPWKSRGGGYMSGGQMVGPPVLPHNPDITDLIPVSTDELWIRTAVVAGDDLVRVDRLDHLGNRAGSYLIPQSWRSLRISRDRLFAVSFSRESGSRVICLSFQK